MLYRLLGKLELTKKGLVKVVVGCALMAFVIVNIHMPSKITEGGILGLTLIFNRVFSMPPALVSPILDLTCYAIAVSMFGKLFLKRTALASIIFAGFYELFMRIGLVLPSMYDMPLLASIIAGLGIGVGCGLVISQGGAAGGDDALAVVVAKGAKISLPKAYFILDVIVLTLSLVYIPAGRIIFSLITTTVSSIVVGQFEVKLPKTTGQVKKQRAHAHANL